MFRKLGLERTPRDDRRLAAYLAAIAGTVNSAGFVVIGSFTSHVTGNVGRFADQVAFGHGEVAAIAGLAVVTFFLGSLATSMLVESQALGPMYRASAALLLLEATLVGTFVVSTAGDAPDAIRDHGAQAMLLSAAMGVQNALVTRLSGAVVRTTHLTGVVTDLGIEAARWFRYWRSRTGGRVGVRFTVTSTPAERPRATTVALLLTVFVAFVLGSAAGAVLAVRFAHFSLLPIVIVLVTGALYALWSGRSVVAARRIHGT
jgi:uncharacterized membrane protein YoaK (UPF0700 family)